MKMKIMSHGMILERPIRQPEGTKNSVTYEVGFCFQAHHTKSLNFQDRLDTLLEMRLSSVAEQEYTILSGKSYIR